MLELFTCASSALGGGHDESIYDTFMSHLPAVLTAYTQAVYTPSKMVALVDKIQERFNSSPIIPCGITIIKYSEGENFIDMTSACGIEQRGVGAVAIEKNISLRFIDSTQGGRQAHQEGAYKQTNPTADEHYVQCP